MTGVQALVRMLVNLVSSMFLEFPTYRSPGSKDTLKQFSDFLKNAERPAIGGGGGANHSQAGNMILELAENWTPPL